MTPFNIVSWLRRIELTEENAIDRLATLEVFRVRHLDLVDPLEQLVGAIYFVEQAFHVEDFLVTSRKTG
jgi:hypothetical protein